ncbi:MAG: hypothetical protein LCI03_19815 [Actinobacteria bacterium]|nr:hypothetical protein [Actinomycetota bacterium]
MSRTTRARAARAIAPVAGLLAAGLLVWQGSYAAFSASTVNQGDSWATGQLALQNNGGNGSSYAQTTTTGLFGETNLVIGSSGQKCITVSSTGSIAGSLRLYRDAAFTGTNANALAGALRVTVEAANTSGADVSANCTGFPTTGVSTPYNNVALSAVPSTYAAAAPLALAAGNQKVAYRISWSLPTTGSNTTDSALQGSTATTNLNWEIQ